MGVIAEAESEALPRIGGEEETEIPGKGVQPAHGVLTNRVLEILERSEPRCKTFGDLARYLQDVFGADITIRLSDAIEHEPSFADPIAMRANELMAGLDEQREHEIVTGLQAVVEQRERRSDYWPEGCLNLGIAYACLGEYSEAKRWLEKAEQMLQGYMPNQRMAV